MNVPAEHGLIVAIGCSWGGLQAVSAVLEALPRDLPAVVVVVQHRMHGPSDLAALLADHTTWPVCEAEDKETISMRRVYLAPPGYHLLVDGERFALSTEGPVRFSRPSIDVFFEAVAESHGRRVVGVILTGANDDGAAGLAEVARRGGVTVVQDPASSTKPAMPEAALRAVPTATVAPLDELGAVVSRLVRERAARGEQASR